jgi:hypothetical protein
MNKGTQLICFGRIKSCVPLVHPLVHLEASFHLVSTTGWRRRADGPNVKQRLRRHPWRNAEGDSAPP